MQLLSLWPNFREHHCHFIATIGKTSLSRPLAIANAFSIPAFVVFDGDVDKEDNIKENKRDNACILNLCGIKTNPLSKEIIWAENVVMWPTRILDIVKKDIGDIVWEKAESKVRKENGWEELRQKNSLLITGTLEELWKRGEKSAILSKLCENIIAFAKKTN